MSRLYNFYLYGYWHIAFCALILFAGGTVLANKPIDPIASLHIFSATLFIYLLHRYFSASKMASGQFDRYGFIKNHIGYTKAILIISALVALCSFLYLPIYIQTILIITGLLSLGYVLPLVFRKRLRDLGQAKILLISVVWASLPILSSISSQDWLPIFLLFAEHFFFIFALTIPFDIRDQAIDNRAKVSNLVNNIGIRRAEILKNVLIILSLTCVLFLFQIELYNRYHLLTLFFFHLLLYLVTKNLKQVKSETFYLFFLDSFILIKGLIYILISLADS